jgi:hypothetical protein
MSTRKKVQKGKGTHVILARQHMNIWLSGLMIVPVAAGFVVCSVGMTSQSRQRAPVPPTARCHRTAPGTRADSRPIMTLAGMALMLVAMVDMTLGASLLPDVVWGVLLLIGAPLSLTVQAGSSRKPHCGFTMHRSFSMITMAALMLAGGHGHTSPVAGTHNHDDFNILPVLLAIGVAGLIVYTGNLVLSHHRASRRGVASDHAQSPLGKQPILECSLAAISVAAMAGLMII